MDSHTMSYFIGKQMIHTMISDSFIHGRFHICPPVRCQLDKQTTVLACVYLDECEGKVIYR